MTKSIATAQINPMTRAFLASNHETIHNSFI
jgi:hypothetical protein